MEQNYIKSAISRAIESGYDVENDRIIENHVVVPKFWQALLKATNWPSHDPKFEPWQYYMLTYNSFKNEFSPETQFKQFFTINEKRN